jgi:hypothetical protein
MPTPIIQACFPRSAKTLQDVVASKDVEHHYLMSGGATFCNQFVRDVLAELGTPMPRNDLYAHQQIDWLASADGQKAGWKPCSPQEAAAYANGGHPCIATYRNPLEPPKGHSHIAIVVPATPGPNIAQAGAFNFSNKPVKAGFGPFPVKYFWCP